MTFPAGGGPPAPGAGGPAAAPPSAPDPKAPTAPAASGDAAVEPKSPDQPTSAAPAAPSTPKVERPASFREALDRARSAPASEGDTPAPEAPEPKRAPAPATAPKVPDAPKPEESDPAPDKPAPPKKDAAEAPAPKVEKAAAAAATAPKTDAAPQSDAAASDGEDDEALVEAAAKDDREAFEGRFPEADKGKKGTLDFAYRMARKNAELRPVAELVESVGGMDGAKLAFDYTKALTALARPAATAEEALERAEGFRKFIWKNAPGAAAKLESSIFWNAVADTPEGQANVQALADEMFGDGVVTVEQLKMLGNAFADGRIDLDALAEDGVDYRKTKQQREQEARRSKKESAEVAALREEVAQLKGDKGETDEAKAEAKKIQVAAAFKEFVADNFKLIYPILREYGFVYPDDQNSPAFKSMARRINHVQRDLEKVMEADDDYKAVVGNIANLQTEGVHSVSLGTARNKMRVALREIMDELAPEAAAEIKRKNRLVADRVKQNGKQPTTTAPTRPAAAAAPSSNYQQSVDQETRRQQRRDELARTIEAGRRAEA